MSRQKNSQNYLFVRVIARGQRALLDVDRLLRHVGEGDLDRVLDAVQQLDDHVRHHLERRPALGTARKHRVTNLKQEELFEIKLPI